MCEPTTIAVTAAVIGAVGTGVATYSAVQQSRAARERAQFQSSVAANNAIIANNLAIDAKKRGRVEEQKHRIRVSQFQADQEAAFAASGLDLSSGSIEQVLSDTAAFGELDALTIRNNSEREAFQFLVSANNATAQSQLFQAEKKSHSPLLAGTSTFLTGASQTGFSYISATR